MPRPECNECVPSGETGGGVQACFGPVQGNCTQCEYALRGEKNNLFTISNTEIKLIINLDAVNFTANSKVLCP